MKTSKNLLTLLVVAVFILMAIASSVNKIHSGAFYTGNRVEEKSNSRNYVVLNDGSKVYGSEIKWKSGFMTKDVIAIDNHTYKITDVKGYRKGDEYYARFEREYIERIVRGKLNVYINYTPVTTTSTVNGKFTTSTHTRTDIYVQRGDEGAMVRIGGQKDILQYVADCPLSVAMIDQKDSKIRKAIKQDHNYMNKIFEIYNNDCKAVD